MNVYFYVNGLARLVMACAIADQHYADCRKHLILLYQHRYNYDSVLPQVRHLFASVLELHISNRTYSHRYQLFNTYLNPYFPLRRLFKPNSEVVLFDISSPVQKFIVRRNKRLGNRVVVYAESLAVDRCFVSPGKHELWRRLARRIFTRAFAYQHDYDVFYVHNTAVYQDAPSAKKLRPIADLYLSPSFARYAEILTAHLPLESLKEFDLVFFGQPLSNYHHFLSREEEERMLHEIIGEKRALILPHPNERLDIDNKYSSLKNAQVLRSAISNELLLLRLRPRITMTFGSTIALNHAITMPESMNYFFPVMRSHLGVLQKYVHHMSNIHIDNRFVTTHLGSATDRRP